MILLYIKLIENMSLNSIKKSIFISIGSFLFIAGLVFLLIPVLPGFLFVFLGLNVLAKGSKNISKNKLIIKYLDFSQKYMDYIKRLIKTRKKSVIASIIFATLIASMIVITSPAEASFGINSSFRQVKTANSPVVYYLDHKIGKKKAYVNEVSYLTYGNKWSDVKIVHPEALRAWEDINLVKSQDRPEVFYIENGTKKWIQTEEEFVDKGYKWSDIVTIAQADLDQYTTVGENPYKGEIPAQTPENNNSNYNTSSNSGVLASNAPTSPNTSNTTSNVPANISATGNVGTTDNNVLVNKGVTIESINYSSTPVRALANTNSNLVATYKLSAAGENVSITKITLNTQGVFNREIVKKVYLTVGNDSSTEYEGYSTNGRDYQFDFHFYPINVLSGRDKIIKVYVDFAGDESTNFQTIKFTMNSYKGLTTDSYVYGKFPLQGTSFELVYIADLLGQAVIEELNLDRALEIKIGSVNEEIAAFKITETTGIENLKVAKLIFENLGSATQEDIENIVLKDSKGRSISQVRKIDGRTIAFSLDNYQINKDASAEFSIYVDVVKGENKTINLRLKKAAIKGDIYEYAIVPTYLDVAENITIIREKLNVISNDLKVTENVFSQEEGTLIGVYEIRNNNQNIILSSIKLILSKSESAPALKEAVYLVDYETGAVYDYAKPIYDDFISFDIPKISLGARQTVKLAVIATIPDRAEQGDMYGTELSTISYKSVNSGIYLEDTMNVPGKTVIVSKSNLFIYENFDAGGAEYIKGENGIKIASFYLEAAYGDDVLINGITLTKGDTAGLITYENGFSNLRATIGNSQVGATIERPYSDTYNFKGFSYILRSGQRQEVSVYVDTSENMRVNSTQLMLSKIVAQSNVSGIKAVTTGLNAKSYIINFGEVKLAIQAGSSGSIEQGEDDNFVGSFTLTNSGDENIRLGDITLLTTGRGFSSSLGYRDLEIRENESSRTIGLDRDPVSGANRIGLSGYIIEKNNTKTFDIYVDGGDYDMSEGFELRFAELTAEGQDSRIPVVVVGQPTAPVIVGMGNTFVSAGNNNCNNCNNDDATDLQLIMPVQGGTITATFHDPDYYYRDLVGEHTGIDIEVPQGTVVMAAHSGVVYSVIDGGYGHTSYIIIDHGNGYRTLYAHLSQMNVEVGEVVSQGEEIGLSGGEPGTYGAGPYTNGAHLHFEVQKDGIPVDPMDYLN